MTGRTGRRGGPLALGLVHLVVECQLAVDQALADEEVADERVGGAGRDLDADALVGAAGRGVGDGGGSYQLTKSTTRSFWMRVGRASTQAMIAGDRARIPR